jgi:hypothetical protein
MGEEDGRSAKASGQAAEGRVNGIVFDAGGLIALERNDRRVLLILRAALEDDGRVIVPATALAQVIRNPARQVRLWRMIQFERTEVVPLDGSHAQAVGALLGQTATTDIIDAHVVICAQAAGYAVVTSDPLDLKRLDPKLRLIAV